jgi:hypothetical protein
MGAAEEINGSGRPEASDFAAEFALRIVPT